MGKNDDRVLAIDIGGYGIRMAEFSLSGAMPVMTKFAFRRMDEQAFGDDDAPGFAEVYHEMLESYGFTAGRVRLSISAQSSFQRLSKLPAAVGSKSAISKIVEFEARQTVPYAMEEVEWDYQLIRHVWEETVTETNEEGVTEERKEPREEFEALFVAVKTEDISQYTDVIMDSGKTIVSVDIAPIALFNAAKATQAHGDDCVMLLNIGGRGTSLMIADANRAFIRNIPIAGGAVTAQVAKEFSISMAEAEELKRRYGFVALGGAYEEPESELAATISKIARNVMTRLHGEISRSINVWRAQHGGRAPTRVLLSGGGSTMLYVTDFFQEKLRVPVEYLNTFGAVTLADTVDKETLQSLAPMVQELIGISLRDVIQCPIDISLLPREIRKQRELDRRKPYLYAAAVLLVVCLAIFLFGVNRLRDFESTLVGQVGGEVERVNRKMSEVNTLVNELNSAKGAYDEALGYVAARHRWTDMLNELESIMPDMMWLTHLEGVGDLPTTENNAGTGDEEGLFGVVTARRDQENTGDIPGKLNTADIGRMTEIRQIRLSGYTLIVDNRDMIEEELRKRLKDSKFFTEESELTDIRRAQNLTSFKLLLNLKESIKK